MLEIYTKTDVMVVAESPSVPCATFNRVWAGKALSKVKALFQEAGIDAYYTYAMKCQKPGKNFAITPSHLKACNPYLLYEIHEVQPKHIIVLGSEAMKAVSGKSGITDKRGNRWFDSKLNAYVYPTYNQNNAAFNREVDLVFQEDLRLFIKWITGKAEEVTFNPPVTVIKTLAQAKNMMHSLCAAKAIACDIETTGLNPYAPDFEIRSIQFCSDPSMGGYFVPLKVGKDAYHTNPTNLSNLHWNESEFKQLLSFIEAVLDTTSIIWHNGKFDRTCLYVWGKKYRYKLHAPRILMDTMHVAHLLDENRPVKLKKLITEELGFPTYDISNKLTNDLDVLIPYASNDTVATFLLYKKYKDVLNQPDNIRLKNLYTKLVRKVDKVFTNMELRGWPADPMTAEVAATKAQHELETVLAKIHAYLDAHKIKYTVTTLGSPSKLADIIFNQLKLTPASDPKIAKTAGGSYSTNNDALTHLKHHEFVSLLLEYRKVAKALSTYILPMLEFAQTHGVIRTSYKVTGTVTGRTASGKESGGKSARGMNLQNLPYTYDIKKVIRAPRGWKIFEIDFSQIELRLAGESSKDPLLLYAYANNKDLHAIRAMRIVRMDEETWETMDDKFKKEKRKHAKPVNFGYLYGMSAKKFQQYALTTYDLHFTMQEATQFRESFFEDHTGLEKWYKQQEKFARTHGYVETITGRRRHLPNIKLDPESSREAAQKYADAVRQAINSPIQGSAGELKLMSLVEIEETIPVSKLRIFGEVHDSIVGLVRDGEESVLKTAANIMRHPKILDELGIILEVPIDVEASVGPSLGELQPFHV